MIFGDHPLSLLSLSPLPSTFAVLYATIELLRHFYSTLLDLDSIGIRFAFLFPF